MTYQLPLFPSDDPGPLEETPDPLTLLRWGAAPVLSVFGGQESKQVALTPPVQTDLIV
ncbi:MAG: hypothetical protein KC547_21155 [Anaerolineae bacterium]|nr:hypothetical protein [Anaerolineae bacterium]